jgi:signal transduction histidine kinase
MSTLRTARIAYLTHAVLSALVIGLLSWATVVSLRLESAAKSEALARAQRDHERSVQLAVYQMENLATAVLSQEMLRPSADYAPLYYPGTDEIRLPTGEMLRPGSLVRPSPLLLQPPQNPWVLLHFQVSPRSGYRSPQIVPDQARRWPDLDDSYEASLREQFAATLAHLQYAYTVDELACKYEQAGGSLQPNEPVEHRPIFQTAAETPARQAAQSAAQPAAQVANRSEYSRRKQAADFMNRVQTQQIECAPEDLAVAQLHAPASLPVDHNTNELTRLEEEIGISYRNMLPTWVKLANRESPDLAFLRAVHTDGEVAFEGFLVDWPRCEARLLAEVHDRFAHGDLEIIDPPPAPDDASTDDTVLGVIPARFVPNSGPVVAAAGPWNGTHTFLLIGWVGSFLLLLGAALGIRSLVSLTERRTQFAYAVTHELRTPLTTFRLYTDMLSQGLVPEENRQSYLETLNQESQRLADLVSGVLEYSRVENNCVPINREHVTVGHLLECVRETCAPRCATAGMRLDLSEGELAETTVETDRHHLVQIIGNLVDNACKYGRNERDPVVHVTAERSNGALHFDVIDEGRGVPQRLRSLIFQPYQRGDEDSVPATGGIGLGLALSKSWAKLLGGNLELLPPTRAESGAHFRLSLPIRDLQ